MFGRGVQRRIYLDYASAPPVSKASVAAMRAAEALVGNPGAIHREAVEAKRVLEQSRAAITRVFEVKAREIIFTAGLTEANNIAIVGFARRLERTRRSLAHTHWIVSAIEHSSVLACFAEIERLGGVVTHVLPDEHGIIKPAALAPLLRKETVFVSIGWANNELGTIQPLRDVRALLRDHESVHGTEILLHSDAGQAPLYLPTTIHSLGVDLMSMGANKLYGPHGIGALFLSNRAALASVQFGGAQERSLRPGTENVALAAGFAAALERMVMRRETEAKRLKNMRDDLARTLLKDISGLVVNGDITHALPHMLNISIPDISSEYVTLALDARGVAVSTKSACREGEDSASHAVAALGRNPTGETLGGDLWRAQNTLRISLGEDTTTSDLSRFVSELKKILPQAKR